MTESPTSPKTPSSPHASLTSGLRAFSDAYKGEGQLGYARIKIQVHEARNLIASDPDGKADPYCIITVGSEKDRTIDVSSTLNPTWNESFKFRVPVPGLAARAGLGAQDVVHYVVVEVWDYDRLNPDDFMGRVMLPIASLQSEEMTWYKLGTMSSGTRISGEIMLSISIADDNKEEIGRWAADGELYTFCKQRGYHLPILATDGLHELPGVAERVEMLLSPVLIESSQRRSVGSVYLTDYRIVISCNEDFAHKYGLTSDSFTDLSMWIPLQHIEGVEKFTDDKVIQNAKEQGSATALVIRCYDFRVVRVTFLNQLAKTAERKSHALALEKPVVENDDISEEEEEGGTSPMDDFSPPRHSYSSSPLLTPVDGAANYRSSHGAVKMGVPFSDVMSSLGGRARALSTLAQERIVQFFEQLKGQKPFSVKSAESSLSKLVKVFQDRLEFIALNPRQKAFSFLSESELTPDLLIGHDVYSPEKEFERQQISDKWAASKWNVSHKTSPTYPEILYLPSNLEDRIVRLCAEFRSKCRIPTLCWYNSARGNFIMRSSQPMPGTLGKVSVEDETLVEEARLCTPNAPSLVIFDARSVVAAEGNKLKGLGTENAARYRNCKLLHLDIGNIHAMRESIDKLRSVACQGASESHWLSKLEDARWLQHIAVIIKGASTIARYVGERDVSLLVHCSDGWDRTTQLTSLAQLMLDPYYRTFDGFKVLVEKEWLSFGHKFKDRLGNPNCPHERSPVFLQFLDCTWQIMEQFQSAFEFSPKYLLTLAELHFSGWFGTFLLNSEKQRKEKEIAKTSVSIWAHMDAIRETLLHPGYIETTEIIQPNASVRRIRLWFDFYLRYDETSWPSSILDTDDTTTGRTKVQMVVWVPDSRAKVCYDCKRRFTHFRRRHHCRACGQVFCNECSSKRILLPSLGYTTGQRVCDACAKTHDVLSVDKDDFVVLTN